MRNSAPTESIPPTSGTPQSYLLTFLGMHLLGRPIAINGGKLVEIFGWMDVGQSATRSLLARMTDRGVLVRTKDGRNTYYGLTPHGSAVLDEGSRKVWRGTEETDWNGEWTTVAMSVPEDSRHLRHRARSRLGWSGFGYTASGLWVAPRPHDVQSILGAEFADIDITVTLGRTAPPTTDRSLVASAYDLAAISQRYTEFLTHWNRTATTDLDASDAFVTRIKLQAHWLSIGRTDPLLPASLLPEDWPATPADALFRELDGVLDGQSTDVDLGARLVGVWPPSRT